MTRKFPWETGLPDNVARMQGAWLRLTAASPGSLETFRLLFFMLIYCFSCHPSSELILLSPLVADLASSQLPMCLPDVGEVGKWAN